MTSRRAPGAGSIYQMAGYWWASVMVGRRKVRRRRRSEEEARAALLGLLDSHATDLGYHYHAMREWPRRPELIGRSAPRSGITAGVRWTVLARDGFRCVYCGATAAETRLTVDHRLSVADGGTDELENLAAACLECNIGKGKRSMKGGSR